MPLMNLRMKWLWLLQATPTDCSLNRCNRSMEGYRAVHKGSLTFRGVNQGTGGGVDLQRGPWDTRVESLQHGVATPQEYLSQVSAGFRK